MITEDTCLRLLAGTACGYPVMFRDAGGRGRRKLGRRTGACQLGSAKRLLLV